MKSLAFAVKYNLLPLWVVGEDLSMHGAAISALESLYIDGDEATRSKIASSLYKEVPLRQSVITLMGKWDTLAAEQA